MMKFRHILQITLMSIVLCNAPLQAEEEDCSAALCCIMPTCNECPLVNLRSALPEECFDMRFATEKNITGRIVRESAACFGCNDLAIALKKAQKCAVENGYCLKIYEAYEPPSEQIRVYRMLQQDDAPSFSDSHARGMGVDCTLTKDCCDVDMGCFYECDCPEERISYMNLAPEILQNRAILCTIMQEAGFEQSKDCIWHFDLKGWQDCPAIECCLEDLEKIDNKFCAEECLRRPGTRPNVRPSNFKPFIENLKQEMQHQEEMEASVPMPAAQPVVKTKLMDMRAALPKVQFEMRYATDRNPMSQRVHCCNGCYGREELVEALQQANAILLRSGHCLKVLNAYQPKSECDLCYTEACCSNPKGPHCRGMAVDVVLVSLKDGKEVDMCCDYTNPNRKSCIEFNGLRPDQQMYRTMLEQAMEAAGFGQRERYCWHFGLTNWKSHPIMDTPLEKIEATMRKASCKDSNDCDECEYDTMHRSMCMNCECEMEEEELATEMC